MKTMKPFYVFLLNVLFILACITLLPFHFETNDDPGMIAILNGSKVGRPDFHTVFMNIILGYSLFKLYSMTLAVEWYTLFLVICHIVSCTIISTVILNHFNGKILKSAALAFLCFTEIYFLAKLRFTTTAGLMATASLLLVCAGGEKERIAGIFFFVLASLVRYYAAMLVGLVFIFFYPIFLVQTGFCKKCFVALCVCACAAFSCHLFDRAVYHANPEWNHFFMYNKVRGALHDNPNAGLGYQFLPEGVDAASYKLFVSYFFGDVDVMNLEVLEQIVSSINKETDVHGIPGVK